MRWTLCMLGVLAVVLALVTVSDAKALVRMMEVTPSRRGNTNVDLTVNSHRISIPLRYNDEDEELFFEYTGRFYFLDGKDEPLLPGPVLRASPGGKIKLRVRNRLGAETADRATLSMNTFHFPNTTNVHFHGIHANPKVDDPFTAITKGGELWYKVALPRDHEPGMHWYHAHSHGSAYQQVMGGLFGAIVVGDGSWLAAPKHPFRKWDDTILMFHLYRLGKSDRCDGTTMQDLDAATGTGMPANPQVVDHTGKQRSMPSDLYLVNGQHRPTVSVIENRPMVLRMVFAAGSCHLNLTLPKQCSFHVFAVDGVQLRRTHERHWMYFTTATRVEAAVICHATGEFPVHLAHDSKEVIFYIASNANHKSKMKVTFPVIIPRYSPDYLYLNGPRHFRRDISLSQLDLPEKKPFYIMGQGENCSSLRNSSTCYYEPFPGKRGTDAQKYHGFAVPLHTVITAHVFGDPTDHVPHPFHLHTNHFQILGFVPRHGGQHENHTLEMYGVVKNQFRDTVPILDGVTTIRWQAASYLGEIVYHCHALHHEDRGMMLSYLVYPEWAPAPSVNTRKQSSSTSRRAITAALMAMLLISAAAALVVVGARWYREHPHRNYEAYYTSDVIEKTGYHALQPPLPFTEQSPLLPRH